MNNATFSTFPHLYHLPRLQVKKTFEVKEYVPPKYDVSVEAPDFLLLNDEKIKGSVCARYTYGKRVRGAVKLKIRRTRYNRDDRDHAPVDVSLTYCGGLDLLWNQLWNQFWRLKPIVGTQLIAGLALLWGT